MAAQLAVWMVETMVVPKETLTAEQKAENLATKTVGPRVEQSAVWMAVLLVWTKAALMAVLMVDDSVETMAASSVAWMAVSSVGHWADC